MRIAIVALSVRGAMGQYLEALAAPLSHQVELHLFVPSHYEAKPTKARLHFFKTGANRRQALLHFLNPWEALTLWKRIQSVSPDLVHLFNGEGYPWSLLLARWVKTTPFVVTLHDPEPHPGNFVEWMNAWGRRPVLKKASVVHIHTQRFSALLSEIGISQECIRVIPHGSIAAYFTDYAQPGVSRENVALFFGRIEPYKGLDTLIDAGLRLRGQIKILIAGPGAIQKNLSKTLRKHSQIFEVHNRYLSKPEVAQLFQRAAVCVLPYHQATQSSIPLIAAAFGVPVVATDMGALAEDVGRVNGLLVPPRDATALAQAILEARTRPVYYPKELEFEALSKNFVALYDELIHQDTY
jgi:glycosyltransferase involved in cell wall biosynthesis